MLKYPLNRWRIPQTILSLKSVSIDKLGKFSSRNDFVYDTSDLDIMDLAGNYHNWVIKHFKPYLGRRIFEVGAGSGSFMHHITKQHRDFDKIFVSEPSRNLHVFLIDRLRKVKSFNKKNSLIRTYLSDSYPIVKKMQVDTFIYNNVLEHVENDAEEIKTASKLLVKGGHLLTYTPATKFAYSNFDKELGHYRRYSLEEMVEKHEKAGLKVVEKYYMDSIGLLLWILRFKIMKSTSLSQSIAIYDKTVVPLQKLFEPSKLLPIGKNVLVISQKV